MRSLVWQPSINHSIMTKVEKNSMRIFYLSHLDHSWCVKDISSIFKRCFIIKLLILTHIILKLMDYYILYLHLFQYSIDSFDNSHTKLPISTPPTASYWFVFLHLNIEKLFKKLFSFYIYSHHIFVDVDFITFIFYNNQYPCKSRLWFFRKSILRLLIRFN